MAAALITTAAFPHRQVIFLSDCTAAIGAAAGECSHQLQGIPQAMSSARTFRSGTCQQHDQYRHIPGHQGIPGNELADAMSKAGAHSKEISCCLVIPEPLLAYWVGNGGRHLPWAALAFPRLAGLLIGACV